MAVDPYPSQTATLAELKIVSVHRDYDGTVVIRARERSYNEPTTTGGQWELPTYVATKLRTYASYDLGELYPPYAPRRSRFKTRFPGEARAEMPSHVHQQAPRARPRPMQRMHHFASTKVWERRNKPMAPRSEAGAR
jgi:hypothetical protein